MVSRRSFARMAAAAGVSGVLLRGSSRGQTEPVSVPQAPDHCSVMLWTLKGSFAERLGTAASAGFHRVELVEEFRQWTEADWTNNLAKMKGLGLRVDAMAGVKAGFAEPGGGEAYVKQLEALAPVAHRLGTPQIILLSGPLKKEAAEGQQHAAAVETLGKVARVMEREGLTGVVEPIDRLEQPTIYLDGVTEAFALTRAVGSPQVKVLYDLYHEQRSQGNLIEKLEKNIGEVGLIHVADVPGRYEPGTGEVNYTRVYGALGRLGYTGVVAMEFYPQGDAVTTLRNARLEAERGMAATVVER